VQGPKFKSQYLHKNQPVNKWQVKRKWIKPPLFLRFQSTTQSHWDSSQEAKRILASCKATLMHHSGHPPGCPHHLHSHDSLTFMLTRGFLFISVKLILHRWAIEKMLQSFRRLLS
jgi:hypothetical protein